MLASSGRRRGRRKRSCCDFDRGAEAAAGVEEPVDVLVELVAVAYVALAVVGDAAGALAWEVFPYQWRAVAGFDSSLIAASCSNSAMLASASPKSM